MSDQLKMHSLNGVEKNIEQIAKLFPNTVTEVIRDGKVEHAIDFDILKQELSNSIVEGREERYQFTWPEKKKAILAANAPISATLRPIVTDSVGKDGTNGKFDSENLYIEGDNLEVLKLLQETYLGKIKMIYIDPPYNTGNDFVYEDNFAQNTSDYMENSGQFDEEGNRMSTNLESNGRFHTDWLNMMYPRLKLAKDLLTDDGVIFISIDDNEFDNLKKICDEIFGAQNFIAQLVWERAYSPKNDAKFISNSHDYVLMFVKNINTFIIGRLPRTEEANMRYKNLDNDPRGVWKPSDLSAKRYTPEDRYPITTPSGRVVEPPAGRSWSLSKKAFLERLQDNRIWFGPDGNNVPQLKRFLTDLRHEGLAPQSILFYKEVGHSQEGAKEVISLFDGKNYFDGPKPIRLLYRLLTLACTNEDSLILDFFSGSATTAHAVMKLNAEDGGHRKFIMVQLPEVCDEKSEAFKAGYKNICEIGKERIRRAGKKIKEDSPLTLNDLDVGFRCLRLDTSNMKDVYYKPSNVQQMELASLIDNVREDRTSEDLLFQVMLDMGILLSNEIKVEMIDGKKVFIVGQNNLIACFDKELTEETVTAIAKMHPNYAVFRDGSLGDDSLATNFEQIFEAHSPKTVRKVL